MEKNHIEPFSQLKRSCEVVCQIAERVATFIRKEYGQVQLSDIDVKSRNSLVSYVDTQAERQLVDQLQSLLPQAAFLTEEGTVETQPAPYQWIIDPLDGTTNFLHQLPFFAISIALQHNRETVLGVVYEVMRKECFYTWKGGGAWLNGTPIMVNNNAQLQDAMIATGFPYFDYSHLEEYLGVFQYFMKNTRGIRRFGAAALDLAFVACGRFDAFYEYSLNPWDVAAGALLVQEAGGQVSDFKGEDNFLFGKEIVAGSTAIHNEVMGVISKYFSTR